MGRLQSTLQNATFRLSWSISHSTGVKPSLYWSTLKPYFSNMARASGDFK